MVTFVAFSIVFQFFHTMLMLGFPGGSPVKNPPVSAGDGGLIPESEGPLEKEKATLSSILVWKIPWTEGPGGLQSMGWQELDRT